MSNPTSNQVKNKSNVSGTTLTDALNTLAAGSGPGGVTDHGLLTGLADDDHTQYFNQSRGDARYSQTTHSHAEATVVDPGFMSAADKVKLNGISAGATVNDTDVNLKNRANHTGTQAIATVTNLQSSLDGKQETLVSGTNIKTINSISILGSGDIAISGSGVTDHGALTGLADDDHPQYHNDARGDARYATISHSHSIVDVTGLQAALDNKVDKVTGKGLSTEDFTTAEKTKLGTVATGATANDTDVNLKSRANHTGTQAISTVTGLQTALDTATNFTQTGTGASPRTVSDKLKDTVSVKDFGAVGDNVTDDTTAFNNALASGAKRVLVPKGTYFLNSTVTIGSSGVQLFGDGPYASILRSAAAGPAISVSTGLSGIKLNNFQLTRTAGTAASGYDGIKFNTLTEQADISNLILSRHWVGLSLCATSFSFVREIIALNNYSHGVLVANNASYSGLQWSFFKCLSQTNNGFGLLYSTATGASGASVGDIQLFSTYANKLGGAKFEGTATSPINGIRWFGGFVGEDGNHGLWLDTYNVTNHKIEGLFAEIAGTSACGVDMTTAATGTGHGILVTANNGWVDIIGGEVVGNSYNGIDMSATRWSILSTIVRLNGANAAGGNRNGIRGRAGAGTVVGCSSKGHATFGIFCDVDTISLIGNDVRENTTGSIASSFGTFTNSVVIGNQGFTDNNILSNLYINGVKILGTRDTGWTAMTGTANEATSYATGSITLVQLAERVKAIQDALTTHGLIGT